MKNHPRPRNHGMQGHPDTGREAGWEQNMLQFWFRCRSDAIPGFSEEFPLEAARLCRRKIQPNGLPREGIKYLTQGP